MPEIRQSVVTKEWVIISTERAKRPEEFAGQERPLTESLPEYEEGCPFCPGNEEPGLEVMRTPQTGAWQVRVVRNKYPALSREGGRKRHFDGVHRKVSGIGWHEVIVECPRHNACPALETPEEVALTLKTFQMRGLEIARDPRIEHVIFFKNHGPAAGTSLQHPHTQLIALPIVPYDVRTRTEEARRYFDDTGECVFCFNWQGEASAGSRIVFESANFVAFVPYAAFSPFHLWIFPRRHQPTFLTATEEELDDLGRVLRTVLRKLYFGLRDPDYNYVIRSAPLHDPGRDYLHWYLTIVPRITRTAGFEMGSGMFINTSLPEESAGFLRSIEV
jgi:UDPglucose--hexose-1-phosphate uridylyltransferase